MVMDINILQWKYKRRYIRGMTLSKCLIVLTVLWLDMSTAEMTASHCGSNGIWHIANHNVCPFTESGTFLAKEIMYGRRNGQMQAINSTSSCRPVLDLGKDSPKPPQEPVNATTSADGSLFTNTSATPYPSAEGQNLSTSRDASNTTASLKQLSRAENAQSQNDEVKVNCSAIQHNFTLVTALINLHRENWTRFKRSFDHYLYYSIQLLKLNAPLVIYVDPSVVEFVRFHRQGKEHLTKIIETSVDELEYYQYIHEIRDIMNSEEFKRDHPFVGHPEGFSAEYNILMNSKFPMLSEAALLNVFNSTHFYWIDMAYGHGDSSVFPESCDWEPANIMYTEHLTDRITYIAINNISLLNNIYQIYKKDVPPFISGGFFGGSVKAVIKYYHIHRKLFRLFLLHKMVDDDQTLAILCYFEDTSLFHFVKGWWFDAFRLFH